MNSEGDGNGDGDEEDASKIMLKQMQEEIRLEKEEKEKEAAKESEEAAKEASAANAEEQSAVDAAEGATAVEELAEVLADAPSIQIPYPEQASTYAQPPKLEVIAEHEILETPAPAAVPNGGGGVAGGVSSPTAEDGLGGGVVGGLGGVNGENGVGGVGGVGVGDGVGVGVGGQTPTWTCPVAAQLAAEQPTFVLDLDGQDDSLVPGTPGIMESMEGGITATNEDGSSSFILRVPPNHLSEPYNLPTNAARNVMEPNNGLSQVFDRVGTFTRRLFGSTTVTPSDSLMSLEFGVSNSGLVNSASHGVQHRFFRRGNMSSRNSVSSDTSALQLQVPQSSLGAIHGIGSLGLGGHGMNSSGVIIGGGGTGANSTCSGSTAPRRSRRHRHRHHHHHHHHLGDGGGSDVLGGVSSMMVGGGGHRSRAGSSSGKPKPIAAPTGEVVPRSRRFLTKGTAGFFHSKGTSAISLRPPEPEMSTDLPFPCGECPHCRKFLKMGDGAMPQFKKNGQSCPCRVCTILEENQPGAPTPLEHQAANRGKGGKALMPSDFGMFCDACNHSGYMSPDGRCMSRLSNSVQGSMASGLPGAPIQPSVVLQNHKEGMITGHTSEATSVESLFLPRINSIAGKDQACRVSQQMSIASLGTSGPLCRICHSPPDKEETVISPCRCNGTLKYVHTSCLIHWLEISCRKLRKPPACELCGYKYRRHKVLKLRDCAWPMCTMKDRILHVVFIIAVLMMIVCAIITIICFRTDGDLMNEIGTAGGDSGGGASGKAGAKTGSGKGVGQKGSNQELGPREIVTLICGVLFFCAFFVAMYVEVKAKTTIYKLAVRFWLINHEWFVDEYVPDKDQEYIKRLKIQQNALNEARKLKEMQKKSGKKKSKSGGGDGADGDGDDDDDDEDGSNAGNSGSSGSLTGSVSDFGGESGILNIDDDDDEDDIDDKLLARVAENRKISVAIDNLSNRSSSDLMIIQQQQQHLTNKGNTSLLFLRKSASGSGSTLVAAATSPSGAGVRDGGEKEVKAAGKILASPEDFGDKDLVSSPLSIAQATSAPTATAAADAAADLAAVTASSPLLPPQTTGSGPSVATVVNEL